jgi:hypothetical protein
MKKIFIFLILSLLLIGSVSAGCCLKATFTPEGGDEIHRYCISNLDSLDKYKCDDDSPSLEDCSYAAECSTFGTCIDKVNNICIRNSLEAACEGSNDHEWIKKSIEEIEKCDMGCCVDSNDFTSKMNCNGEFDTSIKSQAECSGVEDPTIGACVFSDGDCNHLEKGKCLKQGASPYSGQLCSNPNLDSKCEASKDTMCYNNKVYSLDDCGNRGNVYNYKKVDDETDDYWKEFQDPSCDNGDAECGNCKATQQKCVSNSESNDKAMSGNYVCKDLTCKDGARTWKNGESECIFDGYVGDGKDLVGSEHWIKTCLDGDLVLNTCGDLRKEICANTTAESEETYPTAVCRPNEGYKCYDVDLKGYQARVLSSSRDNVCTWDKMGFYMEYVSDEDWQSNCMYWPTSTNCDCHWGNYYQTCKSVDEIKEDSLDKKTCEDISKDCVYKEVDLAKDREHPGPLFGACVPKYPIGLEFWEEGDKREYAEETCGIMDSVSNCETKWIYYYSRDDDNNPSTKYKGKGYILRVMGGCIQQKYTEKMNDLCISLGDCGGYVNTEGVYTKNFKVNTNFKKSMANAELENDISAWELTIGSVSDIEEDNTVLSEAKRITYESRKDEEGIGPVDKSYEKFNPENWKEKFSLENTFDIDYSFIDTYGTCWRSKGANDKIWSKDVKFSCQPWSAPTNIDNCNKCNKDEFCTEYKCRSLGADCKTIEASDIYDTEDILCIGGDDNSDPVIEFEIVEGAYNQETSANADVKLISSEDSDCILGGSNIEFKLKTTDDDVEEYTRCVYSWFAGDISQGDDGFECEEDVCHEFFEGNQYSKTHTFKDVLPKYGKEYVSEDNSGEPGEKQGNLNMYVKCMDAADNFNRNDYVINFCIREGLDKTHANIMEFIPEDGSYLAFDETTKDIIIKLDKPAECRWSHSDDEVYDNMIDFEIVNQETTTGCDTSYYDEGENGRWSCSTTLIDLMAESENNIYIKCSNQPWICDNSLDSCDYDGPWEEADRKKNAKAFPYTLYKTKTDLNITSIFPQGDIFVGLSALGITLEVETSGGADEGVARCSWDDGISIGRFLETDSTIHTQAGFLLDDGDYEFNITCEDEAENVATGKARFNLDTDEEAPIIVRAYKEGGSLEIITNEEAECYFDWKGCDPFSFESKESTEFDMTDGIFSRIHSTDWLPTVTYYIKCKDKYGNVKKVSGGIDRCTIIAPSS